MANVKILLFVTCYFGVLEICRGERLHEKIYSSIEGGAACFRRLNGTHQTGCTSKDKGAVGVVHIVKTLSDAQWIAFNSSAGPYVAVISTTIFSEIIEVLLAHPENVAGVLLYNNATMEATTFSLETKCPNEFSSASGSLCSSSQTGGIVWNENGLGLIRRDIPFPIFYLPNTRIEEIEKIEHCYNRFNLDRENQKGRPLCSLQLNTFMFAAVSSVVCLRRSAGNALFTSTKVCDPLGDRNVFYSLFPRRKEENSTTEKITLVTARIDTASLFDGISPGAASSVVGMVTLLAVATTLSRMNPVQDPTIQEKRNVMFALFNGEAFDYIGSQRVAYDMSRGAWPPSAPLSPDNVGLHLEIGQIGGSLWKNRDSDLWPFSAFAPYSSVVPSQVTEFLNEFTTYANQTSIPVTLKLSENLPPSSLHSFRRILKNVTESGDLAEILLVDHSDKFTNLFYHSVLDDYSKIAFSYHNISIGENGSFVSTEELIATGVMKESETQVKIARLATALARVLYQRVSGTPYFGNLTASAHLIDELLYCYLESQACNLLLAADYGQSGDNADSLSSKPAPLYVGVASWPGTAAVFAGHLLALLSGEHLPVNKTVCDETPPLGTSHYWLKGWNHTGVCIQTTMNFSQAVSPAFIIPDYELTSGLYSTWTESVWNTLWARVFVSSGGGGAIIASTIGGIVTLIALLLTYWLKKHAAIVFINAPNGSLVNNDATGILRTVNC